MSSAAPILAGLSPVVLSLVLMIPFFLIALILLPFYLSHGYRHGTRVAAVSLLSSILGVAIAALLAWGIGALASGVLSAPFASILSGVLGDDAAQLINVAGQTVYLSAFARALAAYCISLLVYGPLCVFFLILFKVIFSKITERMVAKTGDTAPHRAAGLLIRLLDTVLVAFLLLAPSYTLFGDAVSLIYDHPAILENMEEQEDIMAVCGNLMRCPTVAAARLPVLRFGRSLFASFSVNGERFNHYTILNDTADISGELVSLLKTQNEELTPENYQALQRILTESSGNPFLCGVASDLIVVMRESQQEIIPTDSPAYLLLRPLLEADHEQLTGSIRTLGTVMETPSAKKVFNRLENIEDAESPAALISAINDPEFISDTITALRGDPLLSQTVDSAVIMVIDEMTSQLETEEENDVLLEVLATVKKNIADGSADFDTEREVLSFTYLVDAAEQLASLPDASFAESDAATIAHLAIGIGIHPYIDTETAASFAEFAVSSIDSEGMISEQFTREFCEILTSDLNNPPAIDEESNLENLIVSAQGMVEVLDSIRETGEGAPAITEEAVGQLLDAISDGSASALSSLLDPTVIGPLSGNQSINEETVNFLRDVVVSMAQEKPDDPEARAEDARAIAMILRVVANVDTLNTSGSQAIDALQEVSGCTINDFVSSVAASDMIMGCIDSVSGGSDAPDPLGIFSDVSASAVAEIANACDRAAASADAETAARLAQLARFMGAE